MPDITNPQAVRFANEQVRHVADLWCSYYNAAKVATTIWAGQGLDAAIPNTADFVADGSEADGRGRLTGAKIVALKGILDTFIADAEAGGNAKRNAVFAAAVNPRG